MGKQQESKTNTESSEWIWGCSTRNLIIFPISLVVTVALYCHKESRGGILSSSSWMLPKNHSNSIDHFSSTTCNLFSGKWVFDNKSMPLYKDRNCKFMFEDYACEKYGRKDLNYQYWRWQPHNCDLPMFNGKALLERLSGKRLVFVGDSLNRNQWASLICLIESSIPLGLKSRKLFNFIVKEYNATIDFHWAPLLVESNSDDPYNHHLPERIVRLESIENHSRHWADADILVFNSYLWWKTAPLKAKNGSFEDPNQVPKAINYLEGYKKALETWSKWLLSHVNPTKSQLFWVSMSPPHTQAEDWGMPSGRRCYNETDIIRDENFRGSESDPQMMRMVEAAIEDVKMGGLKIDLLNITRLSEFRKDAHPYFYKKLWRPLTKEQLANPMYGDCTHWCLPGVPDVWNQLLYAYLVHR